MGALLQDEGPWFFTLFSREEPPFLKTLATGSKGVVFVQTAFSTQKEERKTNFKIRNTLKDLLPAVLCGNAIFGRPDDCIKLQHDDDDDDDIYLKDSPTGTEPWSRGSP